MTTTTPDNARTTTNPPVGCTRCDAKPGEPCRGGPDVGLGLDPEGPLPHFHAARVQAANRAGDAGRAWVRGLQHTPSGYKEVA